MTRPEDGAGGLADQLRARGAVVVELPLLRVVPPEDVRPLRDAAARLWQYDWIVFTSANAVRAFREAQSCVTARAPRIAVVGPATAQAAESELGWRVDVMPETFAGASIVAAMQAMAPLAGARVLWPRAADARDALRRDLSAAGAVLDDPIAYRTIPDHDNAAALVQLVREGGVDVITFTSPSAVQRYAERSGGSGVCIAVIGASTAAAARAAGLTVQVQPAEHTLPALVQALEQYLSGR